MQLKAIASKETETKATPKSLRPISQPSTPLHVWRSSKVRTGISCLAGFYPLDWYREPQA